MDKTLLGIEKAISDASLEMEGNQSGAALPYCEQMEEPDKETAEKEQYYPVMTLKGNVLFPGSIIPISVKRKNAIRIIEDKVKNGGQFVIVTQKAEVEEPELEHLCSVGSLARIMKVMTMPDGSKMIIAQGTTRVDLKEICSRDPYLIGRVQIRLDEEMPEEQKPEFDALIGVIKEDASVVMKMNTLDNANDFIESLARNSSVQMINVIASTVDIQLADKQEILQQDSLLERAKVLYKAISEKRQLLELRDSIRTKVKEDIDKEQKAFFLNQEIKAMQKELGENPNQKTIEKLKEKAAAKKWGKKEREMFDDELQRLQRTSAQSPEYSIQLDYLETLVSLPWNEYSEDNFDVKRAEAQLDKDHYGLEKVKERILEHLAVLKLKKDLKSPILCLYGPPGVGKTSLGKSIAESLGRKYIRMSLGGLHDESEIRGHRRTYLGAMMGRVMQNIKKAGTSNPVFVLDEIDKITASAHGDPQSALLEVLDPEQNKSFHDNYLNVDFDLSKVMFIATANNIQQISAPLLDRMELIEVTGYVIEEKVNIAKRHLMPKQLAEHGLAEDAIALSDDVLSFIIERYTRESGVRSLDKQLATICRKLALKTAKGEELPSELTRDIVKEMLGVETRRPDVCDDNVKPGVVTGLAWTAVGGEILFIEASASAGKSGKLTLTGKLGDVMKESAMIALEYVRANASAIGVGDTDFDALNLHIHVPEGAIPKDGPSAGITMATAIVSALKGKRANPRYAMTGEITLQGKVLPVGGIKEKILAAKRAGITDIILCEENRRDIEEIKALYVKGVTFHYVSRVDEVLKLSIAD